MQYNINDTIQTDLGEYEVIGVILDEGSTDKSLNLYICEHTNRAGDTALIAVDNASAWVVGCGDSQDIADQIDTIKTHIDIKTLIDAVAEISSIDAEYLNECVATCRVKA